MKNVLAITLSGILLVGSTACAVWRDEVGKRPDEVLFARASEAMEVGKFDVAGLSLVTLINTFPDSEYRPRAEELLRDPRLRDAISADGSDVLTFMPR